MLRINPPVPIVSAINGHAIGAGTKMFFAFIC